MLGEKDKLVEGMGRGKGKGEGEGGMANCIITRANCRFLFFLFFFLLFPTPSSCVVNQITILRDGRGLELFQQIATFANQTFPFPLDFQRK